MKYVFNAGTLFEKKVRSSTVFIILLLCVLPVNAANCCFSNSGDNGKAGSSPNCGNEQASINNGSGTFGMRTEMSEEVLSFSGRGETGIDINGRRYECTEGANTEPYSYPVPALFRKEYYGSGRPRGLCTADMNLDGNIDVIVADREYENPYETGSEIKIWLNNGMGMMLSPSPPYQTSNLVGDANLVASDLNNDGFPDIVQGTNASSGTANNFTVFINDGSGNLMPGVKYNTPTVDGIGKVAAADFNGDGFSDIVASDAETGVIIYFNNGSAIFDSTAVYNAPFTNTYRAGCVFPADFNNDGWEDILLQSDIILVNNGAGVFGSTVDIGGSYHDVCVSDFDTNGYMDVAAASTIFWNDGNLGYSWEGS